MGRVNESVKTFNSLIRTLLACVLVGGGGYLGYKGYEVYNEPNQRLDDKQAELDQALVGLQTAQSGLDASRARVTELDEQVAEQAARIERLDTALTLMKVRRRVARLTVVDQETDSESGAITTTVEFVETNEEGHVIGEPKQFHIDGDRVYIEYLVAKFDDKYVEQADLERGTAICLFQRIFGENQLPSEGYVLDEVGTRPNAYVRGTEISEFERQIWDDFWTLANNPARARELGIRAAHGVAPSYRVRPEMVYQLELRTTGEFTLRPSEAEAADGAPSES